MIFQILNIAVYSKNNEMRSIALKPDGVNIITGKSKTGKSALTHIVDYCLGAKECRVPAGVIRKNVEWYAIKLKTSNGEIFIARKNPPIYQKSKEDICFMRGSNLALPAGNQLIKNGNLETLNTLITHALGIKDYSHEPPTSQTRKTGSADSRKALFYCFQEQSEIDNQKFLFHRQGDDYIPQTIKDYLPFFLGAITDKYIQGKQELQNLKRELKKLERGIAETEQLGGENFEQAYALIEEAKMVHLIDQNTTPSANWLEIANILRSALLKNNENDIDDTDKKRLDQLFENRRLLRNQYRIITEKLSFYEGLKTNSGGYKNELIEQNARLESIELFSEDAETDSCPLCASILQNEIPTVTAIKKSLTSTKRQLEEVSNDIPHLDQFIQELQQECDQIRAQLSQLNKSISSVQNTNEHLAMFRDDNEKTAMVKGRLSFYLEHIPQGGNEAGFLADKESANTLKQKIERLQSSLDDEDPESKINSVLSRISTNITSLAKQLALEHSDSPMRLDLKQLTIVADTEDGPIKMPIMGSGETWVGLHVSTHLALHQWFVEKSCPVPQFLFFDQPSQAYFPPDTPAEKVKNQINEMNTDRSSIINMFKLIEKETKGFQVIITEHADIQEHWFQNLVREKWWDDENKLIPIEWLIS